MAAIIAPGSHNKCQEDAGLSVPAKARSGRNRNSARSTNHFHSSPRYYLFKGCAGIAESTDNVFEPKSEVRTRSWSAVRIK